MGLSGGQVLGTAKEAAGERRTTVEGRGHASLEASRYFGGEYIQSASSQISQEVVERS